MKVCSICSEEICTPDGENRCVTCEEVVAQQENLEAKARARKKRRERDDVMRSLGLVKVRGSMGGTYWE